MTIEEIYTVLHGNYKEAKTRLMSDRLIDKFMRKFPNDKTMQELLGAVESHDKELSFRAAHTLKGVAANMAFTELALKASALTEQLRPLENEADPALLEDVKTAYQLVIDTISANLQ